MTRLVLVLLAGSVLTGSAAAAHGPRPYCGHARVGTLHTSVYVMGWTDTAGRHRHMVQQGHPWGTTPRYITPACPS